MNPALLLVAVALLLGLLLFLLRRLRRRAATTFLEVLILTLAMLIPIAWVGPEPSNLTLLVEQVTAKPQSGGETLLGGWLLFAVISLPMLLLVRFVPNRLAVILGCFGWLVLLCAWVQSIKTAPVLANVREVDVTGLFSSSLLVGTWVGYLRLWLWPLLACLGGLYAVRRRFSYARLVAGTVLVGYGSALLLTPFTIWPHWYVAPWFFGAFAALLVSLPGLRGGLERLLGIRLGHGAPVPALPYSPSGAFAGHFALLVLAVAVAGSAGLNYYERVQAETIMKGPAPQWRSAAETNAFDQMQRYYRKGDKTPKVSSALPPDDWDAGMELLSTISSGTRERIFAELDLPEWKEYFARMREFTDAFERASQADYLQMPGAEVPLFLNLRDTARTLAIQSQIAIRENRPLDAVHHVRTIYQMGGLMNDQPTLVGQMVGAAIRGLANEATWGMLAQAPDNQELLDALAAALDAVAPRNRIGINYLALQAGQNGIMAGPVIPNVELMIPAIGRAHHNALLTWNNFERVRLATALQLHKLHAGGYPGELQELSPNFLKRIPREPIEGREYAYRRTADGNYELVNLALTEDFKEKYSGEMPMPPATAGDRATTGTRSAGGTAK